MEALQDKESGIKSYADLTAEAAKKRDEFFKGRVFFAFSEEQLKEGMDQIGLKYPDDNGLITGIGCGAYLRKTDVKKYAQTTTEIANMYNAVLTNNDEILTDALVYEMSNHEYIYLKSNVGEDDADKEIIETLMLNPETFLKDEDKKALMEKAKKRYFGTDEIDDNEDNHYFILVKETDPSYEVKDALKELCSDGDIAERIARSYWDYVGSDADVTEPLTWEAFEDDINNMSPMDAFNLGAYSHICYSHNYVKIDGYGNYESISDTEYYSICTDAATSEDCLNMILEGEISVPETIGEILKLFAYNPDEICTEAD